MNNPGAWRSILIRGKAADLFVPAGDPRPARAVLHLHGHSGVTLAQSEAFTRALEAHKLACLCPHGGRSWWLDRICTEFDPHMTPQQYLLDDILPWIEEEWGIAPPQIGLTGISMGGQGVLQLSYRHPRTFPVVAALAPAIDFHQWHGRGLPLDEMFETREAARQATALLQIHPLNWPRHHFFACDPADVEWHESADKLAMKLSSSGIAFECDLTTSAGGHEWSYFDFMAPRVIGWVAEKLELVSRTAPGASRPH